MSKIFSHIFTLITYEISQFSYILFLLQIFSNLPTSSELKFTDSTDPINNTRVKTLLEQFANELMKETKNSASLNESQAK